MTDIIYKDLSYKLNGIFYSVYNVLGSIYSEKQYQDVLEVKFKENNIKYEREKDLFFDFQNNKISGNKVDFVIENKTIIDIKAKKYIARKDYKQMLRYLKAGKYRLGLIVNFGSSDKVTIKRIVNSDLKGKI